MGADAGLSFAKTGTKRVIQGCLRLVLTRNYWPTGPLINYSYTVLQIAMFGLCIAMAAFTPFIKGFPTLANID